MGKNRKGIYRFNRKVNTRIGRLKSPPFYNINEDGTWCFTYNDQSVAYDTNLEETEADLHDEFKNGKNDSMTYSFGNYSYKKVKIHTEKGRN